MLPSTNRWCCWSTLTHRYIDDLFKRHTHLFVLIRQLKSSLMFHTLPLLQHSANIRLAIIVIVFDLSVLEIWCKQSKMLRQKVLKHFTTFNRCWNLPITLKKVIDNQVFFFSVDMTRSSINSLFSHWIRGMEA